MAETSSPYSINNMSREPRRRLATRCQICAEIFSGSQDTNRLSEGLGWDPRRVISFSRCLSCWLGGSIPKHLDAFRWAAQKKPVSFHYTGWFIKSPAMGYNTMITPIKPKGRTTKKKIYIHDPNNQFYSFIFLRSQILQFNSFQFLPAKSW